MRSIRWYTELVILTKGNLTVEGRAKVMRLDKGQIEVIEDTMAQVLRLKTPTERIGIGFAIWESTQKMQVAFLKSLHPDWNEEKIKKEAAQRLSHGPS